MSNTIVFLLYSRKFLINFTKTSTMPHKDQCVNQGQMNLFLLNNRSNRGICRPYQLFSSNFRYFSYCTQSKTFDLQSMRD